MPIALRVLAPYGGMPRPSAQRDYGAISTMKWPACDRPLSTHPMLRGLCHAMPSLLLSLVWTPEARRTPCRGPGSVSAVTVAPRTMRPFIAIEHNSDTEQTQMQVLSCLRKLSTRHDFYIITIHECLTVKARTSWHRTRNMHVFLSCSP
jgi:hypothetical protein